MIMRAAAMVSSLLLLASCVAVPSESYDPRLYDASGNVVAPVASAPQAAPDCREATTTVVIGGRQQRVYGTACRQPDGSWHLVD